MGLSGHVKNDAITNYKSHSQHQFQNHNEKHKLTAIAPWWKYILEPIGAILAIGNDEILTTCAKSNNLDLQCIVDTLKCCLP